MTMHTDFELLFDSAPISLWLEDYSLLKALFEQWRAQGVTDLETFLHEDPARMEACAGCYRVLRVNRHTLAAYAAQSQEDLMQRMGEVLRSATQCGLLPELLSFWQGHMQYTGVAVNYALDGRRMDVRISIRILEGYEDTWSRGMVAIEDISEHARAWALLEASERHARNLFEFSPVSLWVNDFSSVKHLMDELRASGITDFKTYLRDHPEFVSLCMKRIQVLDVNQQTLQMFSAPSRSSLLSQLDRVFQDLAQCAYAEQLTDLWNGTSVQTREVINHDLNGQHIHIHMQLSVLPGYEHDWSLVLISLVDISAHKRAEAHLEYLSKHDALTQLRNRAYFVEELKRISRAGPWPLSVMAMDLNGLKQVNDTHGHAAGDAMLRRTGEVLAQATAGQSLCVARTGGDEFVILMAGHDERAAQALKERIDAMLAIDNQTHSGQKINLSIGIASCPTAAGVEEATHLADQRMYAAKRRFYEEARRERRSN
nr:GGDEF domain-containing protein [uncultured Rhodoferax sp.]